MSCCFFECSVVFPSEEDRDRYAEEPILGYENDVEYRKFKCTLSVARTVASLRRFYYCLCSKGTCRRCRKCCWITSVLISILLAVTFVVLFVIVPLPFKNSIEFQRSMIFHPVTAPHSTYNISDVRRTGKEITNGYLNVKDDLRIGFWNVSDNFYNIREKPTLIHFHNQNNDRLHYRYFYQANTRVFNVIAFDYRSYGDSSPFDLVEDGLVNDAVYVYKWVLNRTQQDIYVWGDQLGAAIATHTVSRLLEDDIVPAGLILGDPFTSVSEWLTDWYWPLGQIFSWMPWYDTFVTNPLMENDLSFNTSKYILDVNCPILIFTSSYYGRWNNHRNKQSDALSVVAAARDALSQGSVTVNYGSRGSMDYYDEYSRYNNELDDFMAECSIFKKNHHRAEKN